MLSASAPHLLFFLLHLGKVIALNNMWVSMSQDHTVKQQGT